MNLALGHLDRLRNPPVPLKAKPRAEPARQTPIVGAYYTNIGAGVTPEKEYWQLVDAYKSWVYTCVQSRQKILLGNGSYLSIKQIVESRYSGDVMSFNVDSGVLERKKVIGWHKSPRGDRKWLKVSYRLAKLYKGRHSGMGVVVTDDHRILTDRGYIEAGELMGKHKIATGFVKPNARQREFLTGTLLGDASVGRYLTFGHTIAQKEWFDLKVLALRGIDFYLKGHPSYKWSKAGKTAASANSPFWYQMRKDWYDGRIKRLPKNLSAKDLTPLALAAWYMDDGSLHGRSLYLCSESFTRRENEKLISLLLKKDIAGSLVKGKKCRIYIGNGFAGRGKPKNGSAIKFFRMIAPYLPESMRYKLPPEILTDSRCDFQSSLWDLGRAEPLFDRAVVKSSSRRDATTYCIDVEDNHNFVSKGIVCHNCIDKLGKSIAMIPLKLYVYRSKQTGKLLRDVCWKANYRMLEKEEDRKYFLKNINLEREEIIEHPFLELISRPNKFMTRFTLWYNTIVRLELSGLCGWLKMKDNLKVTRQIFPLPLTKWGSLRAKVTRTADLEYWEYRDGEVLQKFTSDQLFPMIYPHPASPFRGMSPLMAQTYPYDIDMFLMQQQRAFFEHGATPGLHLYTDQQLRKEQVDELKEIIHEQYTGTLKAGDTLITHSGLKAQILSQTSRQSMIDEVARFSRDKLITSFDLSPAKVGLVEDVNRANMAGLDRIFIHECLRPKCMLMEESIETFFLPDYDKGLTCDFELPSTEDQEFELKAMEARIRTKVTVIDEERGKLGMEPVDWGKRPWGSFTDVQLGAGATIVPKPVAEPVDTGKRLLTTKQGNVSFWTTEKKDIYWKTFASEEEALEQIFLLPMQRHFKTQCEEVIQRLNREWKKVVGQYAGWSRQRVRKHLKENRGFIKAINIDEKDEIETLIKNFTPVTQTIMKEYGDVRVTELSNLGKAISQVEEKELKAVAIEFNVNDPRVLKWLGSRMERFSREVAGTTFGEIEAILREGFAEGESLITVTETLRDKFESWEQYRAPLIARTETISAMNKSDIESVKQLELEDQLQKHWLSSRDNDTRETHLAADKEYEAEGIRLDEDFKVGQDYMEAPGLGTLAEENINCRCTVYYSEIEQEQGE